MVISAPTCGRWIRGMQGVVVLDMGQRRGPSFFLEVRVGINTNCVASTKQYVK
jgi:hypothetical protein